ncbi:MAG: sulfotransferase [Nitratireductor sp.]
MKQRPVILIGAARSGTKFLRDVIAQDPGFSSVPYDVNYIWRMGNERLAHDVLKPDSVTTSVRNKIRETLFKLANVSDATEERLIEKTVSNTLRVPFIEQVFPDALYVHLVRDGRAVSESALRLWQAPPDKGGLMRKLKDLPLSQYGYLFWFALNYVKGLFKGRSGGAVWGPRYDGIMQDIESTSLLNVVARQWKHSVALASNDLAKVDAERVFTIRFEDLISDPKKVKALVEFIGAKNESALIDKLNSSFDRSNLEKWRDKMSEQDVKLVESEIFNELKRHGYKV